MGQDRSRSVCFDPSQVFVSVSSTFQLNPELQPRGDQAQAIAKLVKSLREGNRHQTLLGVTGSGKTFTMANIIAEMGKPALVFSHNKTLAAQLYSEFKNFFPNNSVEYFVSYFDYYQPEAYIPRTDTYIEKDSSINDEIERLRLSTMGALLTRKDVVVIASVSCIYGLGSPEDYEGMMVPVHVSQQMTRDVFLTRLVDMLYERNDIQLKRGAFRARGDVVEIVPAYLDSEAIRVEFFGDEIDRISVVDVLTGTVTSKLQSYTIFPAKQFVTPGDKLRKAVVKIREEMEERVAWFEKEGKLLEAQRLKMRTEHDIEMMLEMGFCQGIENYSRHLTGRAPGATPGTLLDFFPDDFLCLVDESHVTIPQIGGMYEGDRSRKTVLVEHGFRLPSALDNRPLKFNEFMKATSQLVYVSATPARFEIENSVVGNTDYIPHKRERIGEEETKPAALPGVAVRVSGSSQSVEKFDVITKGKPLVVEQIIRPTGLLDPTITIKPLKGQIDETIELCRQRIEKGERVLVTTLTKRTAEDLTDYLRNLDLKVRYLHSDIDAIERVEILRSLRKGDCDVLVGINLLREGLDLPEVSLVCILDADKEGFLRSETSLIQTAGRAARHVGGEVVLFADLETQSIRALLSISSYRRQMQMEHNEKHGITPQTVKRAVQESLQIVGKGREVEENVVREGGGDYAVTEVIRELEGEMAEAATKLEFERAALLRDQIRELKKQAGLNADDGGVLPKPKKVTYGKPKRGAGKKGK
ncbi:excinuclease ABC subunit B [Prosthecobacter debontii]|uniref:UvrABC system protein B n=1 Tax=Prosthecobacter debontii TaxID=48467 RepID=A0A1T4Z6A9_9BACT|nr:excinuclease ABC subunit UvrB [Prosthecobacter debontii]SKB09413.1 excinuclease ABC subunit B [Prosthecobacter debontii]